MSITATALLKFATGISGGVLKVWLKDRPILEAAGVGLIGLVAMKTNNILAQRGGVRQMERIAERVYENLLDLVRCEFSSLADNDRAAVVVAADDTLSAAIFTEVDILRTDLDPNEFCAFLCAGSPKVTTFFSPAERELYDRLMQQASQYILDIARQLPSFTSASLEEILRRETSLTEKADEIIQEVRRIGSRISDPASAASRFESDYLRAIGRHLDHLELFGVDVSTSSKRYRLSVAYVSLSMEASEAGRAELADDDDVDIAESLTPVDVLAANKRILLRGPAGSGKTTFLQWVAVHCASRSMTGELAAFNERVPFFIHLRKLVKGALPSPEMFPALVAPLIASEMPQGWVHAILRAGRAVLLIDGFDELSQAMRKQLLTWIREIHETFPDTFIFLTTRPHAIETNALIGLGFRDLRIQDMTRDDVIVFVKHWHAAIAENIRDVPDAPKINELQERLLGTVQHHRAIARLATSPLLCAMLCALNLERGNNLPKDRVQLYQVCVDMFLRRDVERQISLAEYIDITDRQKLSLLEDLSYWMLRNSLSEISDGDCARRFEHKLQAMGFRVGIGKNSGEQVRRLFLERSGILRQPTKGVVDFPHRSFQEYLAAAEVLAQNDIGVLVANAHDPHWRETVILTAGRGRQSESEAIIRALLERTEQSFAHLNELVLLMASCVEAATGLSKELYNTVRLKISRIVPPRNLSDANELSAVGEIVLPYLEYGASKTVQVAVACIRTISRVGGEQSILMLEKYAQDERQGVLRELLRAADRFDDDDLYEERVLSRSRCTGFRLEKFRHEVVRRLARVPGLRTLEVVNSWVGDPAGLAAFRELRSLSVGFFQLDYDFSPLSELKRLTSLTLKLTFVDDSPHSLDDRLEFDAGFLGDIQGVEYLFLQCYGRAVVRWRLPIALKVINLFMTEGWASSDGLADVMGALPNLREVTVHPCAEKFSSISPLNILPLTRSETLASLTVPYPAVSHDVLERFLQMSSIRSLTVFGSADASQRDPWIEEMRVRHGLVWAVQISRHYYCKFVRRR